MKTKKFDKKLVLNKKTISDLKNGELEAVIGGRTRTCYTVLFLDDVCWACP